MASLFNRLLSKLMSYKPKVKHWWRESPVMANCYDINVTVTFPDGSKETKWVAYIQLNEDMGRTAQTQVLARMCWYLDLK